MIAAVLALDGDESRGTVTGVLADWPQHAREAVQKLIGQYGFAQRSHTERGYVVQQWAVEENHRLSQRSRTTFLNRAAYTTALQFSSKGVLTADRDISIIP